MKFCISPFNQQSVISLAILWHYYPISMAKPRFWEQMRDSINQHIRDYDPNANRNKGKNAKEPAKEQDVAEELDLVEE